MTSACAQRTFNAYFKGIQQIHGHKCLNRAGKAATMNTICASALQIMLTQSQRYGHILMLDITGRNDILQIHIRRVAAFLDQCQESIEVALSQSRHLLYHTLIFCILMDPRITARSPQDARSAGIVA